MACTKCHMVGHQINHPCPNDWTCYSCSDTFRSESGRMRHGEDEERNSGEAHPVDHWGEYMTFECRVYDDQFEKESALSQHLRDAEHYQCYKCERTFNCGGRFAYDHNANCMVWESCGRDPEGETVWTTTLSLISMTYYRYDMVCANSGCNWRWTSRRSNSGPPDACSRCSSTNIYYDDREKCWVMALLYECECGRQFLSLVNLINHCSAKGCTCYKEYQEWVNSDAKAAVWQAIFS